jgi:TDG/mug DNA glycosylase family protein
MGKSILINEKWKMKNEFCSSDCLKSGHDEILKHFGAVIFDNSEILILGTFPSIKSFENSFYYSHPKNQFWDILAIIYNDKKPDTIQEKISFLKKHKIALWDSICECKRKDRNSRPQNRYFFF